MKAIMMDGSVKEIDTSFIFSNQYNIIGGKQKRIYDTEIKKIVDDIRLGDFYCCSKKQGSYKEVQKAIDKERSHIKDCKNCFWYKTTGRVKEKCHEESYREGDEETIIETTVYKKGCTYIPNYSEKCEHDIDEIPVLFREKQACFFCKHPDGVPDMTDFIKFIINKHEDYNLIPYWNDENISEKNSFRYRDKFASYRFLKDYFSEYFKLENANNTFKFLIDFNTKTFILCDGIGYKEVKRFETSAYDLASKKSVSVPITGWDKFYKWFMTMVDDYLAQK